MPTDDEIADNPGDALVRLRDLRCDLERAEELAIAAAVKAGWSLRSAATALGVSRQAVTQRLQHRLQTRRPKAALVRAAQQARVQEARERRERLDTMATEALAMMREASNRHRENGVGEAA